MSSDVRELNFPTVDRGQTSILVEEEGGGYAEMIGTVEEVAVEDEHTLDDLPRGKAGREGEPAFRNNPGGLIRILADTRLGSGGENFDTEAFQLFLFLSKHGEFLETHGTGRVPEEEESWFSGGGPDLRPAGCQIPVAELGKELARWKQYAVGNPWSSYPLFLLRGSMFRSLEGSSRRLDDLGLPGSFYQEVKLIEFYPGEHLSCESWSGPSDFHGYNPGIFAETEMQALGGLALKSLTETNRPGEGRLFLALEQDRDACPGGVAVGSGTLQVQGNEFSGPGAPAVFEDLDGRGRTVADPRVEVPVGIPVGEAQPAPVIVLIDSGDGRDVGEAAGFAAGIQEESIFLPATEGPAFPQVDLKLIARWTLRS